MLFHIEFATKHFGAGINSLSNIVIISQSTTAKSRQDWGLTYVCGPAVWSCNLYQVHWQYRSTQVMISESRAALHLCTCGNRATTDNGGAAAAVTAAAAVAISLRRTKAAASMPPPPPPWPPAQRHWQWRRLPPLSNQSTICHRGAPPLRQGSGAAAAARHRRAYAVQYNVVTLRSEHIEYRSCPALHWVLACLAFYQYSLWCVCVFVE